MDLGGPGRRASAKLVVTFPIEVLPHPRFRREGSDIHTTLELPFVESLLGSTVKVGVLARACRHVARVSGWHVARWSCTSWFKVGAPADRFDWHVPARGTRVWLATRDLPPNLLLVRAP